MKVVHNAVHAEGVVLLPAVFKVLPSVDRREAPLLPFVVVANHLRAKQRLQSRFYRKCVRRIFLDERVQVFEYAGNERRNADKTKPLVNRYSITSSQP